MQYVHELTSNLANLLTQQLYTRTNSPQKGISFLRHGTCHFFPEFIFARLHVNITVDCVLDLSELRSPSKTLVELEKLMTVKKITK